MDNINQQFAVLVVNYGISNTIVLEKPQFTTETGNWSHNYNKPKQKSAS